MSIKDLFNNYESNNFKPSESELSASKLVESKEFIKNKSKDIDRYIPPIDFTTASNFAKFGSAELYYEYAFKRIYQQYPYDGSLAEKQEFHNQSTFLDKYIFDSVYPKSTGHVVFSSEGWGTRTATDSDYGLSNNTQYISVLGGPHTASGGMTGKLLSETFDNSMIYDTSKRRAGSFEWNPLSGSTIEFWMKKSAFLGSSLTHKEVVLDIWNGENTSSTSYGRIRLELNGTTGSGPIRLTMMSGTDGFSNFDICPASLSTTDVADNNWHHYAVSIENSGNDAVINLYQDGTYINTATSTGNAIQSIENVSGGVNAYIGALQTAVSGTTTAAGYGKLSASLDEFRYWKKKRTTNEIGEYWFINMGGGTNKREYNTDLGVYFKFNEGITTDASIDANILDYSGRISNGTFVGYTSSARSTASGIDSLTNVTEQADPIIYSAHPTVSSSLATHKATGSLQDYENPSMFYNLFPSWMVEQDTEDGQNLRYLTQIMASYFDTLHAQISGITEFRSKRYFSGSAKPNVYSKEILRSNGFVIPNLFIEADILEHFREKDDNEIYSDDIHKIKNSIYQNIYNNLNLIYKSKGTEKSFRNLFRCFGVDSELIKLNLYSDDSTYLYKENYEFTSIAKPVLNFNNENQLEATVYLSSSNGLTYLSSSEGDDEKYTAMTLECEAIFPHKFEPYETGYFPTSFTSGSIVGFHRALTSSASDLTWHSSDTDLSIYVVKPNQDSSHGKFVLTGSGVEITSDTYRDLYDNNKWILAARVKHAKYPFVGEEVTGSDSGGYIVEFYGVNSVANDIRNEFSLSTPVAEQKGKDLLGHTKRIYAGSHKQNFTGSTLFKTDVKVSQVRYWQSHLSDLELREHSFDPTNYGLSHPHRSDAIFQVSGSEEVYVPQIETLAVHWDFSNVTSSNSTGNFVVKDISSGSTTQAENYSMIGKITKNMYNGYGASFLTSSVEAVDKEFIYAAKKRLPDEVYSSDGVVIKSQESETFFQDDNVSDHFYSFEKSPYNAVSQQMINFFGSMKDFNSLVGDPTERYRVEYKQMNDLKKIFFEKVENTPDPERFFEYFKWIDTSISYAIKQLIPASSRFADEIKDVVESHVLERNKFQEKFPLLAEQRATEGVIRSFSEMFYKWKFGHAPIDGSDNKNCLWQKTRRRVANNNVQTLRDSIYKSGNSDPDTLYDNVTSAVYEGNADVIKRLNQPYKIGLQLKQNIHGGVNYYVAKNRDYAYEALPPHSVTSSTGVPKSVLAVGVGAGHGLITQTVCEDEDTTANYKEKYIFNAIDGRYSSDQSNAPVSDFLSYKNFVKGIQVVPFNIMSQSSPVTTGYQKHVTDSFNPNSYITNVHSDTTDRTNTIPMQGPFTERHVGGHQSRHIRINKHDTTLYDADYGGQPRFYTVTPATTSTATIRVVQASLGPSESFGINDGVSSVTFEIDRNNDGVTAGRTAVLTGSGITEFAQNLSSSINSSVLFFKDISFVTGSGEFTISLVSSVPGTIRNISFTGGGSGLTLTATPGTAAIETPFFRYLDNKYTRPEAWRLLIGENPYEKVVDGAFALTPPDYGVSAGTGTYPDIAKQRATFYREEKAKRPVNVKNIKHTDGTSTVGNYKNNYEIMLLQGRKENNLYFRDNPDISNYLPPQYTSSLPHTTHVMGLYGIDTTPEGNVFGTHVNNMQPDQQLISPAVTGTVAVGHFTVTGSNVVGAAAHGAFDVKRPPFSSRAAGSFRVFSKDWVSDADTLQIVRTSTAETDKFQPDPSNNGATGGAVAVLTGSSLADFYNNLQTAIIANTVYDSTSYSATPPNYGIGVYNSGISAATRLEGDFSAQHWGAQDPWTASFWFHLSSSNSQEGAIFSEYANSGYTNDVVRQVLLSSTNRIVYRKYFEKASGTLFTEYSSSVLPADRLDRWIHVTIAQQGSAGTSGASAVPSSLNFYVNGQVDAGVSQNYEGGTSDAIVAIPTGSEEYSFYGTTAGGDAVRKSAECGLDEFGLYQALLSATDDDTLFNGGLYIARTAVSASRLRGWWRFGDDGNITGGGAFDPDGSRTLTTGDLLEEQVSNQHATASENSTDLYLQNPSIYETKGYADYTVRGPALTHTGSAYVGTISVTAGSGFSNTSNITSTVTTSTATTVQDGDTLRISGSTFELDSGGGNSGDHIISFATDLDKTTFWNSLSASIKTNTDFDTISITDNGNTATFRLTSSVLSSDRNGDIASVSGTSFTNVVLTSGGVTPAGAVDGNTIRISGKTFELDALANGVAGSNFDINCDASVSSTDFWNSLSASIKTNTDFDTITITPQGDGSAKFELTSSITGSALNVTMVSTGPSFAALSGMASGSDAVPAVYSQNDVVLAVPTPLLANGDQNKAIIATRFAAPGGPEIECPGYLDVYAREYSVHNALPFRNLTVKGGKIRTSGGSTIGGSGEENQVRIVDNLGKRRGLNTLLSLHCGQFGLDSEYGEVLVSTYNTSGSFNKQHRNRSKRMEYSGSSIITGSVHDNAFVASPIPRSEFQYSWINNTISGSGWEAGQRILGYQREDGIFSSSAGYVEAIVFPTSSNIT